MQHDQRRIATHTSRETKTARRVAHVAPDNVPPPKENSEEAPEPDSDVAEYEEKQKEHPMAEALWSRLWVTEKGIYVTPREQAAMEHLMGRKADAP